MRTTIRFLVFLEAHGSRFAARNQLGFLRAFIKTHWEPQMLEPLPVLSAKSFYRLSSLPQQVKAHVPTTSNLAAVLLNFLALSLHCKCRAIPLLMIRR